MHATRIAVLSVLLTGAGALVSAQGPGWTPVLEVRAETARPTGDRMATSGSWPLVDGQPVTSTIIASSDLCSLGGGQEDLSRSSSHADNLWKFTASLVGADAKGYRVRLTSEFERFAAGASPAPWTDELLLKEGQDVTIETIRAAIDGSCHIRNVTIRARVVLRATDPAVQAARYIADAWLVHTDASGAERRQHLVLTLDGTGPSTFAFEPLVFPLPVLSRNQGDLNAFLQLTGSLRARVRPDGQIDLDVVTARPIGLRRSSDEVRPLPSSEGRKTLVVRDDETVAIDLPAPNGMATRALTADARFNGGGAGVRAIPSAGQPPSATPAVSVKDDRLTLVFGEFFKGHKTQLLIRLHRARE